MTTNGRVDALPILTFVQPVPSAIFAVVLELVRNSNVSESATFIVYTSAQRVPVVPMVYVLLAFAAIFFAVVVVPVNDHVPDIVGLIV
jgi:hypothetical protein